MMDKRTPFEFEAAYGQKSYVLNFGEDPQALTKLASVEAHIPDKLASAMQSIQAAPEPGMAYLYDRALGAGEIYGANNNGDWFGRDELINHHETFEKYAKFYEHHKNKDPSNNIGDVVAAAYNYPLDTVDLILRSPMEKIAYDLKRMKRGHVMATSMGAKVPYDECNYCGNRAKTRAKYCIHLRTQMLKIMRDGRQVYAKNPRPRFVDISKVVIAADPGSQILRKVANLQVFLDPAGINKRSAMRKEIDAGRFDLKPGEGRPVMRPELIEATNHLDRPSAIRTLDSALGELRPDEFQAVLHKDASRIRPDIIPYVMPERVPHRVLDGEPHLKIANLCSMVENLPLDQSAKVTFADFLDRHEKVAYLQYRKSRPGLSTAFMR
jgi:hypothetical protein